MFKPVYAIVDRDGNILDRQGVSNPKNPRIFGRKGDATNSLIRRQKERNSSKLAVFKDAKIQAFTLTPVEG